MRNVSSDKEQARTPYTSPSQPPNVQQNIVRWLPNYLRLAIGVLLAVFYARPIALPGAVLLLFSFVRATQAALAMQGGAGEPGDGAVPAQEAGPLSTPAASQALSVALGIATWLAVSRTGCLPFLLLGLVLAALSVGAHASLRRVGAAPPSSTARLAVRLPLLRRMASPASPARLPPAAQGWSFGQVLGVSAVPEGAQPRLVLKQGVARAWRGCRGAVVRVWRAAGLRARHWWSARGLERR